MLLPVLFRSSTLLPFAPLLPYISPPLLTPPSPSRLVHLPCIVLPPFPPTPFLSIIPLLFIAHPPFLLFLLLSTPSFSAYVSLDPVQSSSTWAFTVCLCVCSSSPFLGPGGVSAWDLGVFRIFQIFAPLAEVHNQKTLPNQKQNHKVSLRLRSTAALNGCNKTRSKKATRREIVLRTGNTIRGRVATYFIDSSTGWAHRSEGHLTVSVSCLHSVPGATQATPHASNKSSNKSFFSNLMCWVTRHPTSHPKSIYRLSSVPPAPMNHVKYWRAGPAEMPFQNWYTANTNHCHLTDSVEIQNTTGLSNKPSNA